jgi:hypothetical protein
LPLFLLPVLLSLLSEVVRLVACRVGVGGPYWSEKGFVGWKLELVGLAEGGGVCRLLLLL